MTYKKPFNTFNKTAQIATHVAHKEKMIRTYVDEKSLSIAVSSAFNNASQFCIALLHTGQIKSEQFWDVHEEMYVEYLEKFLGKQDTAKDDMYAKMKEQAEIQTKKLGEEGMADFGGETGTDLLK